MTVQTFELDILENLKSADGTFFCTQRSIYKFVD